MSEASQPSTYELLREIRFVIESESGLMVRSTDHGQFLPVWMTRHQADQICQRYNSGPLRHRVVEMHVRALFHELKSAHHAGIRHVGFDLSPDGSVRLMPMSEALALYAERVGCLNIFSPSNLDHFIQSLDEMRKLGLPTKREDEYIPLDCPNCNRTFPIHEVHYRYWRDNGTLETLILSEIESGSPIRKWRDVLPVTLPCPHCHTAFAEAKFETVACGRCGRRSGNMPPSHRRALAGGPNGWTCTNCLTNEMTSRIKQAHDQRQQQAKAGTSGCLVLLGFAGLAIGLVAYLA